MMILLSYNISLLFCSNVTPHLYGNYLACATAGPHIVLGGEISSFYSHTFSCSTNRNTKHFILVILFFPIFRGEGPLEIDSLKVSKKTKNCKL